MACRDEHNRRCRVLTDNQLWIVQVHGHLQTAAACVVGEGGPLLTKRTDFGLNDPMLECDEAQKSALAVLEVAVPKLGFAVQQQVFRSGATCTENLGP